MAWSAGLSSAVSRGRALGVVGGTAVVPACGEGGVPIGGEDARGGAATISWCNCARGVGLYARPSGMATKPEGDFVPTVQYPGLSGS